MVVDIGGGSTDIAVISMGGRVKAASLPVAGNAFDSRIAQYVQENTNRHWPADRRAAEKQVACCTSSEFEGVWRCAAIRGDEPPARRLIYTRDLYEPVRSWPPVLPTQPATCWKAPPPELSAADVSGTGILLTGGGLPLRGLAGYIAGELHTDVATAPDL